MQFLATPNSPGEYACQVPKAEFMRVVSAFCPGKDPAGPQANAFGVDMPDPGTFIA